MVVKILNQGSLRSALRVPDSLALTDELTMGSMRAPSLLAFSSVPAAQHRRQGRVHMQKTSREEKQLALGTSSLRGSELSPWHELTPATP